MDIWYSKEKVWWTNLTDDKPSIQYLESFKSSMVKTNELKLKWNNYDDLTITSRTNDLTYIRIIHDNHEYFYFVNGVDIILNNGYVLNVQLDRYATFVLPFINSLKQKNIQVKVKRSHTRDKRSIQFNDELLDNIPKSYSERSFQKVFIPSESETVFISPDGKVKIEYVNKEAVINANKYYVFKSSEDKSGKYTFIPVLSTGQDKVTVYDTSKPTISTRTLYWWTNSNVKRQGYKLTVRQTSNGQTTYTTTKIDMQTVIDTIKQNKYSYNIYAVNGGGRSDESELILRDSDKTPISTWDTQLDNLTTSASKASPIGVGNKYAINIYWYQQSAQVKKFYVNLPIPWDQFWNETAWMNGWLFEVDETTQGWRDGVKVSNTTEELDKLKVSQSLSNLFMGIFYMPNVLMFSDNWVTNVINGKNYLTVDISDEGTSLAAYKIADGFNVSELNTYNQVEVGDINLYKYFNIKYYNSTLNAIYRLQDGSISLGGYFVFGQNAVLITKTDLLSINDSVIEFPYQLPSGTDNYINYVNATMNSANTSINIAKQNMNYNINRIGINSFIGFAQQLISGNLVGAFTGGVNTSFAIESERRGYRNMLSSLAASYSDKENTLGSQINISSNNDLCWAWYMYGNSHYEGVEVSSLDDDTIKQMNNAIYLFGNYCIEIDNINKFLDIDFNGFRYVLFDEEYMQRLIPLHIDSSVPKREYNNILFELVDGIRLWDKIPNY